MSKKVPYLETSPETFQQKDGSGFSNTACPTPTGNRTAAILQRPSDSSSSTETLVSTPWEDTLAEFQTKENPPASGELGEKDYELLQFWNTRIPIRQK